MTEQDANEVMASISDISSLDTLVAYQDIIHNLYELHKLRDFEFYKETVNLSSCFGYEYSLHDMQTHWGE